MGATGVRVRLAQIGASVLSVALHTIASGKRLASEVCATNVTQRLSFHSASGFVGYSRRRARPEAGPFNRRHDNHKAEANLSSSKRHSDAYSKSSSKDGLPAPTPTKTLGSCGKAATKNAQPGASFQSALPPTPLANVRTLKIRAFAHPMLRTSM